MICYLTPVGGGSVTPVVSAPGQPSPALSRGRVTALPASSGYARLDAGPPRAAVSARIAGGRQRLAQQAPEPRVTLGRRTASSHGRSSASPSV